MKNIYLRKATQAVKLLPVRSRLAVRDFVGHSPSKRKHLQLGVSKKYLFVIPVKTGIHIAFFSTTMANMDSRFHGNDMA